MHMPVEAGYRRETAQVAQRLGGVVGAPAPVGVDRKQRNVAEHDDRVSLDSDATSLDELQLIGSQMAQLLQVQRVHQRDDMHSAVPEAVPAVAASPGTETCRYF